MDVHAGRCGLSGRRRADSAPPCAGTKMRVMLREYAVDPSRETTEQDTIYSLLALRAARDAEDVVAQWQDETTRRWQDVTAAQMLVEVAGRYHYSLLPVLMLLATAAPAWGRQKNLKHRRESS